MKMLNEFKLFIMRGNVIDLAVAVIIGGAFGKIVASFVADVLMPPLGLLLGGVNFTDLKIVLKDSVVQGDQVVTEAVTINYGNFVQVTIDFLIIAMAIFMMIRLINKFSRKEVPAPVAPPAPSAEVLLLTEIRDLLRKP